MKIQTGYLYHIKDLFFTDIDKIKQQMLEELNNNN